HGHGPVPRGAHAAGPEPGQRARLAEAAAIDDAAPAIQGEAAPGERRGSAGGVREHEQERRIRGPRARHLHLRARRLGAGEGERGPRQGGRGPAQDPRWRELRQGGARRLGRAHREGGWRSRVLPPRPDALGAGAGGILAPAGTGLGPDPGDGRSRRVPPRLRRGPPPARRAAALRSAGGDPQPPRGRFGGQGAGALPLAAPEDGAGRREALMIRVAVSMGDPLGIGPEVVTLALASPAVRAALRPVVFGDRVTLGRAAALRAVKLDAEIVQVGSLAATPTHEAAGASALAAVDAAANACLAGTAQALCTAPLSKERAALSSPGFVGHTERLALSTG